MEAGQEATARNAALDRARTFLMLVMLLHHAVIPHTHFGHTDPKSWIGFGVVVLATDSFFMATFFFLSGVLVFSSDQASSTKKHGPFSTIACFGMRALRYQVRVQDRMHRVLEHSRLLPDTWGELRARRQLRIYALSATGRAAEAASY